MNCKTLSDPIGSPCTAKGLLESLGRVVSPGDWDSAVDEVQRSVCTNRYKDLTDPAAPDCIATVHPSANTVCQTFIAYMNLAYDRRIPEYRPGAHPTTGKGSPYWPAYEGSVAVDAVVRLTGFSRKIVEEILYELYWGTSTGRISDIKIAHPWTYRLNSKTLTEQPEGTDKDRNEGWFDLHLGDLIRWGLILGVIGLGVYALSAVATTGRGLTSLLR